MPERTHQGGSARNVTIQAPGRIRDYCLTERLGRGGMGTVFKARHSRLGTIVAVKILNERYSSDAEAVARFDREMKAVGRLSHPNIVQALDAGEECSVQYLVMEYIDGIDLSELCRRCGPLPLAEACELMRQGAVGLQAAYEAGLVHRDIKPSNIMLASDGTLKILDLGLSRFQGSEADETELTAPQQVMGTVDYMAPEQALQSHSVDIRADIYSLGCSLYKLLCGVAPFSTSYDTPMQRITAHARDCVPPMRDSREDVPDELVALLGAMLAKEPQGRPSTPAEVVDALAPLADGADLAGLYRSAQQAGPMDGLADSTDEHLPRSETKTAQHPDVACSSQRLGRPLWHVPAPLVGLLVVVLAVLVALVASRFWRGKSLASVDGSTLSSAPAQPTSSGVGKAQDGPNAAALGAEAPRTSEATTVTITDLRVTVHRGEYADLVGDLAAGVFNVHFNDDVRVYAALSQSCYCYLIALNPDGSEQLCYPSDPKQPPEQIQNLEFPGRTMAFFGLTDGVGLQGFVLLASLQPLPAFSQWRESVGDVAWTAIDAQGVWKYDGNKVNRMFNERGVIRERGVVRERVPRPFAETCRAFSESPRIEAVQALAFPVVTSDSSDASSDH